MTEKQKLLLRRLPVPTSIRLSDIKVVAIPLCLGDPRDGTDGCHDRFNAAIEDLAPRETLVIQTGGPYPLALCNLMREVLKLRRPNWWAQFLSIPLGWGTRSEIEKAFAIIFELSDEWLGDSGINVKSSEFKITIASNKAHMRRIKWFVQLYNTNHFPVEYHIADHEFTLRSTIREWIGAPATILYDKLRGVKKIRFHAVRNFTLESLK